MRKSVFGLGRKMLVRKRYPCEEDFANVTWRIQKKSVSILEMMVTRIS